MIEQTPLEAIEQTPMWVPVAGLVLLTAVMKLAGMSWPSIGMMFGGAVAMIVGFWAALFALVSGVVLILATLFGAPLNPELLGPWTDLTGTFIISSIVAVLGLRGGMLAIGFGFVGSAETAENDREGERCNGGVEHQ